MSSRVAIIGSVVALLAGALLSEQMNLVKLHVDSFTIAGVSARTSNAQEATSDGQIGKLWHRLYDETLLAHIPNRVDDRVYAMYTDYVNGKDGEYTFILGAKVSSSGNLPAGFVARKVGSGNYAMFTAQGGTQPEMTVNLWKRIWSLEKPGGLQRAYKTDFEVHYGIEDPVSSKVDVYIGLLNEK